ncbi:hypothetical protein KY331_03960 [Candidatus Woesearchaeota archaeon]|nr:hypothetical protein [Candidatus Woesearchaeota archaeon]
MKEILFGTSNKAKLQQLKYVADYYKFPIKVISAKEKFNIDYEEKGNTPEEIAINGANQLFSKIKKPVLVEDSIIEITALNNKPGVNSNSFFKKHGFDGVINLMKDKKDKSTKITSVLVYTDGNQTKLYKHTIKGSITDQKRFKEGEPIWVGPTFHPFGGGYNAIFLLKGQDKTLAECTAEQGLTLGYREKNFKEFLEFLFKQN